MSKEELIQEVGDEFAINLYLKGTISLDELAMEIGSSSADLVKAYKKSIESDEI